MGIGYTIKDDRGREFGATAAAWGPGRRHSDELTRSRSKQIERSMASDRGPARRSTIIALLVALPFFSLQAVLIPWLTPIAQRAGLTFWMFPLAVVLGVMGPLVMFVALRRIMLTRLVRAYLRAGYCGVCGFPFEGLDAEHDGCTVCPECGSAWRLGSRLP